jgi:glycosyltransferase involved in cell wall biosynthesis
MIDNGGQQPDLSVIIVTYNTADLIGECLASVEHDEGAVLEVFVVDNASTDGGGKRLSTRIIPGRSL